MKNLTKYGIDKIERLPQRQKFYHVLSTSLKVIARKEYKYRTPLKVEIASRILEGSKGKDFSIVYHKIKPLIRKCRPDFFRRWINDTMENEDGKLHPVGRHMWSGNAGYYIDENNILRYKPYVSIHTLAKKHRLKASDNWRRHYKIITEKKQSHKRFVKEKREAGLHLLKMINNPDLFKFYVELCKKKKQLEAAINKKPETFPSRYGFNYKTRKNEASPIHKYNWRVLSWRMHERFRIHNKKRAEKEIIPILEQVNNLEQGNFNVFFESNVYLYSLQKECHHFEQP